MSDPQDTPAPEPEGDAAKIGPDGKVEVTDPAILDIISGGAGGEEDVSPESIAVKNGGCGAGC